METEAILTSSGNFTTFSFGGRITRKAFAL